MPARLLRKTGTDQGEYALTGETTIGRHPSNTISLRRDAISGRHARIRFDPVRGRYLLEDLGSRNGTRLDGERLRGAEPLDHLHVITFADTEFIFQDIELTQRRREALAVAKSSAAPPLDEPPAEMPSELPAERTLFQSGPPILPSMLPEGAAAGVPQAPPSPGLVQERVESGNEFGKTEHEAMPMALPSVLVGAPRAPVEAQTPNQEPPTQEPSAPDTPLESQPAPDAAPHPSPTGQEADAMSPAPDVGEARIAAPFYLVLTEGDESRRYRLHMGDNLIGRGHEADIQLDSLNLSRRHATLVVAETGLRLRDEGSRNHTFVNDTQIDTEVDIPLSARLRFGALQGWLLPIAQ